MTYDEMKDRFTDDQKKLFETILAKSKLVNSFEYEGTVFRGEPYYAAVLFAHNNPTGGDFFVWLQQNYKVINSP